VLAAVVELVAAGRFDELGMKEVSDRSGVALGTIYRYFSSRDHLAAAALAEWARALGPGSGPAGGPAGVAVGGATGGDTMADRLVAILRRAVRAYQRQPGFAAPADAGGHVDRPVRQPLLRPWGRPCTTRSAPRRPRPADRRRILDVVGPVWYQAMIEWVNGRQDDRPGVRGTRVAARLVLAGYER
jgi:AcrR family transcriptional regulator